MSLAKVTRNYQVTIPKDVRTIYDIRIGDTLAFSPEGDKVELVKFRKEVFERAFGSWKKEKLTGAEYVRKLRKEWSKREARWR